MSLLEAKTKLYSLLLKKKVDELSEVEITLSATLAQDKDIQEHLQKVLDAEKRKEEALKDLKDGYLYSIQSTAAKLGIWYAKKNCFIVLRDRWGDKKLEFAIHVAFDPKHGNAKPIEEIGPTPFKNIDEEYYEFHFKGFYGYLRDRG